LAETFAGHQGERIGFHRNFFRKPHHHSSIEYRSQFFGAIFFDRHLDDSEREYTKKRASLVASAGQAMRIFFR